MHVDNVRKKAHEPSKDSYLAAMLGVFS